MYLTLPWTVGSEDNAASILTVFMNSAMLIINKALLQHDIIHCCNQRWQDYILTKNSRDQFINSPKIVLKGKPSRAKVEELTNNEEKRLTTQINNLGKEGLEEKQKILDNAIESQELPSEEVLDKIPLGNVDIIEFRWNDIHFVTKDAFSTASH